VIALCQEMILSGSNVAFRSSVRSIATLGEYRKFLEINAPDEPKTQITRPLNNKNT
jgi:hypothetical protein